MDDQDKDGIRDRMRSSGEKAAADIAQALIGSPAFGQAVSAAVVARDAANDAQRAAMGALNVSSQDAADRLDRALDELRSLKGVVKDLQGTAQSPLVSSTTKKRKPAAAKPKTGS